MELTELTLRILFLFFPGIICHLTIDLFAVHRERRVFEVFLFSFVYGVLSYLIYACVLFLVSVCIIDDGVLFRFPEISLTTVLINNKAEVNIPEVIFAAFVGFFLGLIITSIVNYSLHFRLMNILKITKKFSDPNVWSFAFNLKDVEWAVVRDTQENRMYFGYIQAFRDIDEIAELLLTEVVVFNETTGTELYSCDKIYISRPHNQITIDLPTFVAKNLEEDFEKEKEDGRKNRKKKSN